MTNVTAQLPDELDALDRVLLAGDGTVTTVLEACVGEAIATVRLLELGPDSLVRLRPALGAWWQPDVTGVALGGADQLILRRVLLRGADSGTRYVLAESLIVPARLPAGVTEHLAQPGTSIGRLLASRAAESRREVLSNGLAIAANASALLDVNPGTRLAWRTYRIIIRQRTAMLLTEILVPGRLAIAAAARDSRSASFDRRPRREGSLV